MTLRNIFYLSVALIAVLLFVALPGRTSATQVDDCDEEFSYTKTSDYSDSRVEIDFINTGSDGNPDSIEVEAKSGYALVSVELSVEDDNHNGFYDYSANFPGTFNPNPGKDVDSAKVKVKKVCSTPTPTPTDVPQGEKVYVCHYTPDHYEVIEVDKDAWDEHTSAHSQHVNDFLYAGSSQNPTDDEEWCDEPNGEQTPTPTPTPVEQTPTPTPTPTNDGGTGGPSDGLGCAVNDCSQQNQQTSQPTQAVLGLSSTGSGANIYLNLAQLLSALTLASVGLKLFRKHA